MNNGEVAKILPELDFIKIASKVPDAEAVDAILSLGFLDKNTMSFFVEQLSYLRHAESLLAQLLIYARIGQEGLDESAIEGAMKSLNTTIELVEADEASRGILEETRSRRRSSG